MCGISYNFDVGRKALQINENVITKEAHTYNRTGLMI